MNIAEQVKSFNSEDINIMMVDAEERATQTSQDWDDGSTEYDFADGSVMIVSGSDISVYGSR